MYNASTKHEAVIVLVDIYQLEDDQEFLNFGMLSSTKESDGEDLEATAQPLHKNATVRH